MLPSITLCFTHELSRTHVPKVLKGTQSTIHVVENGLASVGKYLSNWHSHESPVSSLCKGWYFIKRMYFGSSRRSDARVKGKSKQSIDLKRHWFSSPAFLLTKSPIRMVCAWVWLYQWSKPSPTVLISAPLLHLLFLNFMICRNRSSNRLQIRPRSNSSTYPRILWSQPSLSLSFFSRYSWLFPRSIRITRK